MIIMSDNVVHVCMMIAVSYYFYFREMGTGRHEAKLIEIVVQKFRFYTSIPHNHKRILPEITIGPMIRTLTAA